MTKTKRAVTKLSPKEAQLRMKQKHGFNVTRKTIYEWCKTGEIPGARKLKGRWYIPVRSIDRLLD